jgi:S-adenosylmethionine:tRNA ribosyltransferase-isomerase
MTPAATAPRPTQPPLPKPVPKPQTRFRRPAGTDATAPPEARGLERDQVRLLVAAGGRIEHATFRDLPGYLSPGDLLVVNNSATLAAAVPCRRTDGRPAVVHFSAPLDDGSWVVEARPAVDATGPLTDLAGGDELHLPAGVTVRLLAAYPDPAAPRPRMWRCRVAVEGSVESYLERHGRPVRYGYVPRPWPLRDYQTVFAQVPGSAEMASAARPFSTALVTELVSGGVALAPITLHAGLSSAEAGEAPSAERFRVPASTARLVNTTRDAGGRVIAVGTTASRAIESAALPDGTVCAVEGWTNLVLGPDRPPRVVSGLVTGWHEAGASHLLLLEAVAGAELVGRAYAAAVRERYLWHEFGDSALLLPGH